MFSHPLTSFPDSHLEELWVIRLLVSMLNVVQSVSGLRLW